MRDQAMAAIMGVSTSPDFGTESRGGGRALSADFGVEPVHFGVLGHGRHRPQFGEDGTGLAPAQLAAAGMVGPSHPAHPMNPVNQAEMIGLWNDAKLAQNDTARRRRIINPNEGSEIKINRYSFSLSTVLTLAAPSTFTISGAPTTNLRPERVTMNVPIPGMLIISAMAVANVGVSSGLFDAFENNPNGVDQAYDMPTLTPSNSATVSGAYTGEFPATLLLPTYTFVVTFKGPATITA